MESKECTRCHTEKQAEEFYRDNRTMDGLQYVCKCEPALEGSTPQA